MKNEYKFRQYTGEDEFQGRFGTKEEMERLLTKVSLTEELDQNGGGAPIISDTKTAYLDKDDYHTLILGSTGSMKTRTVILPTVFTLAKASENLFISDPKGELYSYTSSFLKKEGYDIKVINLRDLAHSDCWNPLAEAYRLYTAGEKEKGIAVANEFAESLIVPGGSSEDPFWQNAAIKLAEGVFKIILKGAKSLDEVNVASAICFQNLIVSKINRDDDNYPAAASFNEFIDSLPKTNTISQDIGHLFTTPASTLGGIMNHYSLAFAPFSKSSSLQAVSSHSTFDLHDFSNPFKKIALFLITPDEDTSLHFFAASLIKQLYSIVVRDCSHFPTGTLYRRLNFILDEFANMPKIKDMSAMITAARSRNMRFFIVVQSNAQLQVKYGGEAEIIKTNCLNWIYLNSKEDELVNQIMRMTGYSKNHVPLIDYHELTSLRKDNGPFGGAEALVLMSRARPYLSFLPDISRYPQFTKLSPVPYPTTDLNITYFDVPQRIFALDDDEVQSIYADEDNIHSGTEEVTKDEYSSDDAKTRRTGTSKKIFKSSDGPNEVEPDPEFAELARFIREVKKKG